MTGQAESQKDRMIILEIAVKGLDQKIIDTFAAGQDEREIIAEALRKNLADHEKIMEAINDISKAQGVTIERLSTVTKIMWLFLGAGIASFVAVVMDLVTKN